ncbi:MAG: serine acetyltransferase [Jatrophihabitans sp.]
MDPAAESPASNALPAGFADLLAAERAAYELPPQLPAVAEQVIHAFLALLFPHYTQDPDCRTRSVDHDAQRLVRLLDEALALPTVSPETRRQVVRDFVAALPDIRAALLVDAEATAGGDPAASGVDEVILAYPGFFATAVHRMAHQLWTSQVPLLPRVLGELAHRATGIDIHPGAHIGAAFAIDHGTGVVVGETCEIGDRVRLYQSVTLGALVVQKSMQSKRHPTVEDDVIIYSGATILGGDTVIGAGARIGGNVWLTRSVPPGSFIATSAGVDRRRTPNGSTATEETDSPLEFHL